MKSIRKTNKALIYFSDGMCYKVEYRRYKELMLFMIEYVKQKPYADEAKNYPISAVVEFLDEDNFYLGYKNGKIERA